MAVQPPPPVLDIDEVLPGTRCVFIDESASSTSANGLLQKHDGIVLVPQPTQSPNDPLNWSLPRKIWHTALVCFAVALTAATSNVAGSASTGVNEEYGISYDVFNTGAGVLFLAIGYWTLLSSPAVHLYGRRILYLVGATWGLIGNIWFGRLKTAEDAIWTQLFVGASESVAEAVVQLSLLDIWFEHQNGTSMGLSLGWRWIGYLGAIMSAFNFVLFYFGLEETAFPRERYQQAVENRTPIAPTSNDETAGGEKTSGDEKVTPGASDEEARETDQFSVNYTRPKSYWQRIALITPAPNLRGVGARQYVGRLWHTMRIFTFPAVWFAGLQWGMQNIALSFYLTIEEDYWTEDPWDYGDVAVSNMNIPCLIGSVLGCFYGGYFSDLFVLWASRRNRGIQEAEFRLYLMFLCVLIFPTGMWLFGIGSAKGLDWPVPYVGLGFIGFGYGCAGDLSLTYLADCYPDMVLEGMVGVAVINNTLAMIFTFVASYWLDTGVMDTFIELGVLGFVILMLSLPMIVWGKRARRWTKQRYLAFLEIRDGMGH
ncbi:MFS general substrate transporter [Trichoderma longibrachiatum ATCC 18648]|uniref:MFS general substrate transporter n=1 Tax=Trichoderma longibrachiatum ATCC 18648 TaxID=983965 RepID=A0A2T4BQZ0_TRILO|nr:MFS general substrate transporter [Trichoderma longibrachiatum ATCC 18648]